MIKALGKKPGGKYLEKIKQSANYSNGAFQNISKTEVMSPDVSYLKVFKDYFFGVPKDVKPLQSIPYVRTDLKNIEETKPVIVWFGHSSYLLKINGKTILVDPVLSGSASPFSFMVKAFKGADEYKSEHFPEIDILILTHDHYDHLDFKTIKQLQSKVKHICCSLGLASHLQHWGIKTSYTEFDWWDSAIVADIEITAAPARHFTGRGLKRAQTLWSSFIVKAGEYNIYIGGDSGYDAHFKTIGEMYGPFDIAFLESGQYNTSWRNIHMMPEETVQASVDLRAKVLMPVHWAKFSLALHSWNEPIKRVMKKAAELQVTVIVPQIGEKVLLGDPFEIKEWW